MAKNIYSYGGNPISLVFYRSFLALPLLYLLAKNTSESMKMPKEELKKIFLITTVYTLTPIFLYNSYNYISSGLSTTIHFCYPIFILIGAVIIYKTKISEIELTCIALSTIGILLIADFGEANSFYGVLLAFLSSITYAIYSLYFEKNELKNIGTFKLCFYMAMFASMISFVYSVLKGDFVVYSSVGGWIYSIIFSILVSVLAVSFYQKGIAHIGAQKTSIISTVEPVTSIIVGAILLNEMLNLKRVIAILLILTSTIVLILSTGNKKADEKLKTSDVMLK